MVLGVALAGLGAGAMACEGGPSDDARALLVTNGKTPAPEAMPAAATGPGAIDDSRGTADAGAATPPSTSTPPPAVVDDGYEAMCRHYCAALQETDFYACLGRGDRTESECATSVATYAGQCWDLRCAPRLVRWSLCLVQCDSLDRFYQPACGSVAPASTSACPSSAADHDAECRAGCAAQGTS